MEAIRLADTSGRPIAQVERELGLSQGTSFHWRRELQQYESDAYPGQGHLLPGEERLRQLEFAHMLYFGKRKAGVCLRTP